MNRFILERAEPQACLAWRLAFDRQSVELKIRIAIRGRFTALGILVTQPVNRKWRGKVRLGLQPFRATELGLPFRRSGALAPPRLIPQYLLQSDFRKHRPRLPEAIRTDDHAPRAEVLPRFYPLGLDPLTVRRQLKASGGWGTVYPLESSRCETFDTLQWNRRFFGCIDIRSPLPSALPFC